jgi:serine/threonine-protein kinase
MGRPQLATTLLVALALFAPKVARAQTAADKAAAESAFEEGKRLMSAHAYAEACPKFAESLRRDPGLGTMLGLADCFEKNGQTASAWGEFREAAGAAARKGDKREALARENATRLEPLLSKVVVRIPAEADIRGLAVKRDGVDIERAAWGEQVPVDPGVHAIAASAPGRKDWQTTVNVAAQPSVQTVTIPVLDAAPVPPPVDAAPLTPVPASPPEALPAKTSDGRTQRIAGVAVAGAGVVGVVIGSVFGLHAKSKLDDSNANGHCDASNACDGPGLTLRSEAKSAATVSTIAFVLGTAAIAGGAVLWFTAPHGEQAAVGVAPSLRGVTLTGSF